MKNESLLMWILGLVVLLFLFSGFGMMGFGATYGYGGMMNMMYGVYGLGMMLFGWIYGILILFALVLLVVWLFKQVKKKK